jgi:hypothetical protein
MKRKRGASLEPPTRAEPAYRLGRRYGSSRQRGVSGRR